MLLSSVIIVLREILEASLIISLLLVFSRLEGLKIHWIFAALVLGITGAIAYAINFARISEWFEYTGQEITNAGIQTAIFLLLTAFVVLIRRRPGVNALLFLAMSSVVALSLTHEGSEILIYMSGLVGNPELAMALLLGAALGTGIGISIGALFYFGLLAIPRKGSLVISTLLLALFGGNMLSQATVLLIQADYLSSGQPLWDTSALLSEGSLVGELLYALIGYEASPYPLQVAAYSGGLVLLLGLTLVGRRTPEPFTNPGN
ncbi:MAG: iron permease [Porticoccaceae bacterium]|nr:iron permease [Porticoccaceae bacterium]